MGKHEDGKYRLSDNAFTVLLTFSPHMQLRALPAGAEDGDEHGVVNCFGDSTGCSTWWGALLLAAWMAQAPAELFHGRTVIELGCGSAAMPSIMALQRGASVVRATDRSPSNVRAARCAFTCNRALPPSYSAQPFAFEDDVEQAEASTWDVVLFADVLYIEGVSASLAGAISRLLRPGGTVLGAVGLHRGGSWEIFGEMQRSGFVAREITVLAPVRASAANVSDQLRAVSRAIPGAAMGLEGVSNECMLVSWVRAGACARVGPDMAEALHQQVLHARKKEASACEEWVPTE